MITWWSVTISKVSGGTETFGFGSRDGVIVTKFPNTRLLSLSLKNPTVRNWFLNERATVIKICDQYESREEALLNT